MWSHWTCSSLGTIFQPMRINSVPDVKWFCNNKNVLRAQSMVWHFVRHPVFCWLFAGFTFTFRHKLISRKRQQQTGSSLFYSNSVFAWPVQFKEESSKGCVKFRDSVTEYSWYWFFTLQRRIIFNTETVNRSLCCSTSLERYSFVISCCVMILGGSAGVLISP